MKSMTLTGLAAALCLTALSQQRAAAQCCPPPCQRGGEISFNIGLSFGIHCTPKCGHWVPDCPPPCAPYGYPPPAPAAYAAGGQFRAPQPTPIAAPNPPVPDAPKAGSGGVQGVGYTYPAGYGYNAAALYQANYGYPYYQAPSYWYGN